MESFPHENDWLKWKGRGKQVDKDYVFCTHSIPPMSYESLLDEYIERFGNLRVDKNSDRYSAGKAPHKPILLLSLILLKNNNKVDLSNIETSIYLRETWNELWKKLEYDRTGPIHLPLFHMKSDGFWNIVFKPDANITQPKSMKQFNNMIQSVSIKPELIDILEDDDGRQRLINALLNGNYFSDFEVRNLREEIESVDKSFEYEEKILSQINNEFMTHPDKLLMEYAEASRSSSFRRVVLASYDETCSVCGMKLVSSSGVSVLDAAHILPFSKFKNDDLRNGVALCKSHHWLFDSGIISFDSHYRVSVSKDIEVEMPSGIISQYNKEDMILPEEAEQYPSQIALDWHRNNVFYK